MPYYKLGYKRGVFIVKEKWFIDMNSFFFFFFFVRGAPQLMLRTHDSLKAYCATPVMKMKMSSFLPSFTSNGAPVE
jgi:hypothetical protein